MEVAGMTHPWLVRTAVDDRLCERLRLERFDLVRLRREFHVQVYGRLSLKTRKELAIGGTCPRFKLMELATVSVWTGPQRSFWLSFIEHPKRDVDEMCSGEYPISPYLIRLYSALFGIKVDLLLLGRVPEVERKGTSIEIWPMVGTR
jgi:hypothetical protein